RSFSLVVSPPPLTSVTLGLAHPRQECLRGATHFPGDGRDRRPLRRGLILLLHHQSNRSCPTLSRVLPRSPHDSILSREGASEKPEAIQTQGDPGASARPAPS